MLCHFALAVKIARDQIVKIVTNKLRWTTVTVDNNFGGQQLRSSSATVDNGYGGQQLRRTTASDNSSCGDRILSHQFLQRYCRQLTVTRASIDSVPPGVVEPRSSSDNSNLHSLLLKKHGISCHSLTRIGRRVKVKVGSKSGK